jgi:hypothetical protein
LRLAGKKGKCMKGKRHSSEEIIQKLREAEVLLQKGQGAAQACRQIGVTEQTYYLYGLLPLGKRNFRTA